jgi:cell division transport system permease protein
MKEEVDLEMRISTLGYIGKQGVRSIGRNKMFSMASIATMSACIFLFGLFFAILVNMQHIVRGAEEGVAITVFFDEGLPQQDVDRIGSALLARPDVSEIRYVSGEEAWSEFKYIYFRDNPGLADGFRDSNPLIHSNHFQVYMVASELEDDIILAPGIGTISDVQRQVVEFAEGLEGVRLVNRSDLIANVLGNFNVLVTWVSIAIIFILFIVSIFLISNSVTMGINVRKEEINIMKYIGAKDFVVRSPFVLEGLILGVVGAAIPLGLLYLLYGQAITYIANRFTILSNLLNFLPVRDIFTYLMPIGLGMGVVIGFVGSYFTVRRHLRV